MENVAYDVFDKFPELPPNIHWGEVRKIIFILKILLYILFNSLLIIISLFSIIFYHYFIIAIIILIFKKIFILVYLASIISIQIIQSQNIMYKIFRSIIFFIKF